MGNNMNIINFFKISLNDLNKYYNFNKISYYVKKYDLSKDFIIDKNLTLFENYGYCLWEYNTIYSIEIDKYYRNQGYGSGLLILIEEQIFKEYNEVRVIHILNKPFFDKMCYIGNEDLMIKVKK